MHETKLMRNKEKGGEKRAGLLENSNYKESHCFPMKVVGIERWLG